MSWNGEIRRVVRHADGWVSQIDVLDEIDGGTYRWARRPRYSFEISEGKPLPFRSKHWQRAAIEVGTRCEPRNEAGVIPAE